MNPEDDNLEPRRPGQPMFHSSYWPTGDRRPWESIPDWCRRLDSYGGVLVVGDQVETYDTPEAAVAAWQQLGRPPAWMGQVAR